MVKGISRQVIVVHSPDQKLFDQAIFILREGQKPVTDEVLLREAKRICIGSGRSHKHTVWRLLLVGAFAGSLLTGALWLLTTMFSLA